MHSFVAACLLAPHTGSSSSSSHWPIKCVATVLHEAPSSLLSAQDPSACCRLSNEPDAPSQPKSASALLGNREARCASEALLTPGFSGRIAKQWLEW